MLFNTFTLLSQYIINNNIPRIKGIIDRISKEYGNEIEWDGKKYYTFPTAEQLKNVTVEEF